MDDGVSQLSAARSIWKPVQTYTMAAICLLIGLVIGYLLRGSAGQNAASPTAASNATQPQAPPASMGQSQMPTMDQMKHMADKQVEPLLAKLKTDPGNATLWYQVANVYTQTHQFKDAIAYYQKSLELDPKNIAARANMASCLYYTGDTDAALAQLDKSLTYEPHHPGTLMNIGIIKWQAKNDIPGALAAWDQLLKFNPNFEKKDAIQHLIAEAKQQQAKPKFEAAPRG